MKKTAFKEILTLSGDVLSVNPAFKDFTGERAGRLYINGLKYKNGKHYMYECTCDCGNVVVVNKRELMAGDTNSCGCFKAEARERATKEFTEKYKTHGRSGTKEHIAWKHIKQRTCNPDCKEYSWYKDRGMCEEWKDSYEEFYKHIGPAPVDGRRWSVGRIDNDIGYFPGNVRWELDEEQSKNKGKYKNNTTGYNGVYPVKSRGILVAYVASWYSLEKKQITRRFYINSKRDEELAMLCAVEARDQAIRLLNQQGAGYSPNHGK